MLDNIDKHQRIVINGPKPPTPEKHRSLRHQMSTDNVVAPPFNIPNLRVEQRKTSSAEDMARKNSVCGPTVTATTSQTSVGGGFKSEFNFNMMVILQNFTIISDIYSCLEM